MPTKSETSTATFCIDMPLDRLEELSEALRALGLDFNPVNHMTVLHPEHILSGIFTGADADQAIDQLNDHLANTKHWSRIQTPFAQMTPMQRRDLLALVNLHSSWTSDYQPYLLDISEEHLEAFLRNNPGV